MKHVAVDLASVPSRWALVLRAAVCAFAFALASAPRIALAVPVIEAGREPEIIALFRPYPLGGEVSPGYRLMQLHVERSAIEAVAEGASDHAAVRFEHPSAFPGATEHTASFAVVRAPTASPGARAAADRLVAAVTHNDTGAFWHFQDTVLSGARARPSVASAAPWVGWSTDGLIASALALALLAWLVVRRLAGDPWWVGVSLAVVVVASGVLRAVIAPQVALGAWPYSRLLPVHASIFYGPVLAALTHATHTRIFLTDAIATTDLAYATLTPLAVFAHVRGALRDARVALAAAFLLGVLPNHIRFSHSEVEFIPSLLLSSFTFALLHTALSDRSRIARAIATVGTPAILLASIATRELNLLTVPLLLGVAVLFASSEVPRSRRAFLALVVASGGLAGFVTIVLPRFRTQVHEGLSVATLGRAARTVFSLHDTLLNPHVTPPGMLALAVAGAVLLWRARGAQRSQSVLLLAWLALFYTAHAYVTPIEIAMQARYHLHLAPPFVMLAAPALVALFDRSRLLGAIAIAYCFSSPFVHLAFERDVAFDDPAEYAFVRGLRDRVPPGCTVLEFTGNEPEGRDARFGRLGTVLENGRVSQRFESVTLGREASANDDPLRPEARAVLRDPPACTMYYRGLPCFGLKDPGAPIATACETLEHDAALVAVSTATFGVRPYDENLARGLGTLREIHLGLFRVEKR